MESDSIRTITYDYDNKPDTVTLGGSTTRFVYDGNGARIKKITPTDTTLYVGKLYECKASACSKYIFAGGKRIALKASVTDILYYHQDHLGSSRIVTDATGEVKEEVFYDPFGATRADVGTVSVNHKYTSQEFDAETGLYFYNARYYDPVLGRFISPDTIVPRFADPQSLNRYSYVNNNPLNYIDPSGHGLRRWLKRLRQQQNLRKVHKAIFNPGTLSDEYWRRALSHTMIRVVANVVVQYYGGPLGSGVLSGYMSYLNDGTTGDIIKSAVISFASSWVNKQISAYKADDWIGTYIAKPVAKGIFSGAIAGLGGRDPWKTMYETAAVDFALSAGGDAILGPDVTDNAKIQEYLEENREYYLNKYDMVVNISDITVRKGGLWELLRPGTRAEMFVNTINIDAALIGSVDLMGVLRHELFHVYTYNLYGTIPFAISYLENAATWEQITRTMSGCCFK
ncbi:MAG TPA: hypothetical protein DCO77_04140 [Nitrospiraceae bacterium]|nr:hypothetical protein [Nitrospiraceae bacterium]